jgi:hypothetical protein
MLSEQQRDELLIRLDERVDKIRTDQKNFQETADGDGWGRCQVHTRDLESIKSTVKWTHRTVIGGALALVGKFIYGLFGINPS